MISSRLMSGTPILRQLAKREGKIGKMHAESYLGMELRLGLLL